MYSCLPNCTAYSTNTYQGRRHELVPYGMPHYPTCHPQPHSIALPLMAPHELCTNLEEPSAFPSLLHHHDDCCLLLLFLLCARLPTCCLSLPLPSMQTPPRMPLLCMLPRCALTAFTCCCRYRESCLAERKHALLHAAGAQHHAAALPRWPPYLPARWRDAETDALKMADVKSACRQPALPGERPGFDALPYALAIAGGRREARRSCTRSALACPRTAPYLRYAMPRALLMPAYLQCLPPLRAQRRKPAAAAATTALKEEALCLWGGGNDYLPATNIPRYCVYCHARLFRYAWKHHPISMPVCQLGRMEKSVPGVEWRGDGA